MQASRLDPPYQFEWTVFISWITVATAIAELETGRSASPVSLNPRAIRRFSHSQPLFFRSTAGTPMSVIRGTLAPGGPVPTHPHRFWDRF